MLKPIKKSAVKKFVPMYGGKKGGKMSSGAGWGGEKSTTLKRVTKK